MQVEASYEFDPCSLDDSYKEEEVTLDNWKPSTEKPVIVASKWRQDAIGTNFNQEPGIDELRKINMYLKKKAPDSEIMKAFGINAETLIAIKKNKYDPVEGISLDNQSKIYIEFKRLDDRIESIFRAINCLAEIIFNDNHEKEKEKFKESFKKPKKDILVKQSNTEKQVKLKKIDKSKNCTNSCDEEK